jgi:hypothetical protein
MLELAEVTRAMSYDLGSGDGRIVNLAAERHGARGDRSGFGADGRRMGIGTSVIRGFSVGAR